MATPGAEAGNNQVVEFKGRIKRRMYEHIVFLLCLNSVLEVGEPLETQPVSSAVDDSESIFRRFLNSVALFCDTKPGGCTVTAVTIVNNPPEYRVASNQRTEAELRGVQMFLKKILALVSSCDRDDTAARLLREAVSHCKKRVKCYVHKVFDHLKDCIEEGAGSFKQYPGAKPNFEDLFEYAARAKEAEGDVRGFALATQLLIDRVHLFLQAGGEARRLLDHKTTLRQESSLGGYWKELRHYLGRLNAFHIASRTLVSTRSQWPELFQDFRVECVPSHSIDETPFPNKVRDIDKMIGSMTHGETERQWVMDRANYLESTVADFSLSVKIREKCNEKSFKPLVHAEIILLDWLQRTGPTVPTRFFGQFRYIGSSKPTCRLCHYHFHQHESGVQVRPTHANIYHKWKLPNIFREDGPLAEKKRQQEVLNIISSLRRDIFLALEDRTGMRRHHDSFTEITSSTLRRHQLWWETHGTASGVDVELPVTFEQAGSSQVLGVETEEYFIAPPAHRPELSQTAREIFLDEDDEDEDQDGGARL